MNPQSWCSYNVPFGRHECKAHFRKAFCVPPRRSDTKARRGGAAVPVRWPHIILSWLLKSWRYLSREDGGTAQSAGGWAAVTLRRRGETRH